MTHVLIVDDSAPIAYLFRRYFERYGYQVTVADSAAAAIDVSRKAPVDALVTDYRMPGMNGEELVSILRESNPYLPAIIVSAYPEAVSMGLKNVRVLGKPVEPGLLINTIADMLIDGETAKNLRSPSESP